MGEGKAVFKGRVMSGKKAMTSAGIPVSHFKGQGRSFPDQWDPVMTAIVFLRCFGLNGLSRLLTSLELAPLEALKGTFAAFDPDIQRVRPFPAKGRSAELFKWVARVEIAKVA